eukprot:2518004-Rhodomonas_salina.1
MFESNRTKLSRRGREKLRASERARRVLGRRERAKSSSSSGGERGQQRKAEEREGGRKGGREGERERGREGEKERERMTLTVRSLRCPSYFCRNRPGPALLDPSTSVLDGTPCPQLQYWTAPHTLNFSTGSTSVLDGTPYPQL